VLPLDEELARIEAVSQADLLAVVDAFPPEPVVLGTLLPEDTA
jgi:hypothetical protein